MYRSEGRVSPLQWPVIKVEDVVKAIGFLLDRVGFDESCATLRQWAAASRVTPGGQLLTLDAVNEGIVRWSTKSSLLLRDSAPTAEGGNCFPNEGLPLVPVAGASWHSQGNGSGRAESTTQRADHQETCIEIATQGVSLATALKPRETRASRAGLEARGVAKVLGPPASYPSKKSNETNGTTCRVRKSAPTANASCSRHTEAPPTVDETEAGVVTSSLASHPRVVFNKTKARGCARVAEPTDTHSSMAGGGVEPEERQELTIKVESSRSLHEPLVRHREDVANKSLKEITADRLVEVMREMEGHFEATLRRVSERSLQEWRCADPACDRRELFVRLVHALPVTEVPTPSGLQAQLLVHQMEGLEWMASLYTNGLHGVLADDMGLGKTIQVITLLLHLLERHSNVGPHLIVAPKSTLSNWETEFKRFAPSLGVHVLQGHAEERGRSLARFLMDIRAGRPVSCITNYEQTHRNEWLSRVNWQVVVVDEGHRLKNTESVFNCTMKKFRSRMRLLLTGTPFQNDLNEFWALLNFLLPDTFTSLVDFRSWFSRPFKQIPGFNECAVQLDREQEQRVTAQMHTLLAPFMLQRLKAEVLRERLPAKTEVILRVPMSAWQELAYKDLERRTIRILCNDDVAQCNDVNNALMHLRKIVLHPYTFQDRFPQDKNLYRVSGKAEALDRIISKLTRFDHKILIFSQFTSVLDILEKLMAFRRVQQVRLDGRVPHDVRRSLICRFNDDPTVKVFLISSRAGGVGLNLQAADTVVLFDLDWNPQNDKQAIARAHRLGQAREVLVIRLLTDSRVERYMEQRCSDKLGLESQVMGAGMFRKATVMQRGEMLRSVFGLQDFHGVPEHESLSMTTCKEMNRLIARSGEELECFGQMDSEMMGSDLTDLTDVAAMLVRCGRLMTDMEVPNGFTRRDDT